MPRADRGVHEPLPRPEDDEAEGGALAYGPAIVGLTHRFADDDVEARFKASLVPMGRRRLVTLCAVALIVCLVRLVAPASGLVADPALAFGVIPRAVQITLCILTLALAVRIRSAQGLELLGAAFGLTYICTRCWLLLHMGADGSAAMIVGTAALLLFGLPVHLAVVAPVMALASGLMMAIWARAAPSPSHVALLQLGEWLVVVNFLGVAVMRMMRLTLRQQFALNDALRHLATHDGLTGIANRRHYDEVLARQWALCGEQALPLSLVLLDVDYFKLLNDGVGHAGGDDCLRDLARLLLRCVDDPACLVARTGGEEFACVLPGVSPTRALKVAECIMAALESRRMPHPHSPIGPHITVSLGVATALPAQGLVLRDLTGLADRLVYEAKADGRACLRQQVLGGAEARPSRVGAETGV